MKTSDFSFDLPGELIAQQPSEHRGGSRLMVYNRADELVTHSMVKDLVRHIPSDSLMVFNNTRVRKARVYGTTDNGGRVEFLFLQPMDDRGNRLSQDASADHWQVMVSKAKKQKPGRHYRFSDDLEGEITAVDSSGEGGLRSLRLNRVIDEMDFAKIGHVPLPPYINREDAASDERRYQTVYAANTGSVAAPTAGLHITDEIMKSLDDAGIRRCEVTLHVGLGTFLPVRSEIIAEHRMHREEYEINEESAALITGHKKSGLPVLAVGTTSVRTLESAWDADGGLLPPGRGSTDIFIHPGYRFRLVDHIMTNFHTPESTLLMLVSAFAGREKMLSLYEQAVEERYRFFSYGDAMLIL